MLMVGTLRFAHPTSAAVIASPTTGSAKQSKIFLRDDIDGIVVRYGTDLPVASSPLSKKISLRRET
jgi:hypothetical protein